MVAPAFDPKNMIYRNLGNSGLKVSVLSYGGWLTGGLGKAEDPIKDIMKLCYEAGVNTFDTAEVYNSGKSEEEMGRIIRELGWNRREIVVITKLFWSGRKDPNGTGLSRKHILEGMQDSLDRLQLKYVDVIFAHRHDKSTPMEEIVRAFNQVISNGQAHYWGTSEWSAAQIEEAHGVAQRLGLIAPIVEQPQYSLFERTKVDGLFLDLFAKYKTGLTIWSPLASGLLTGKYNDGIPAGSRYETSSMHKSSADNLGKPEGKAKIEKVKQLTKIAERLGCSQTALSLAWCAKNENVSTVILGATTPAQIVENLKALPVIALLTPEIMQEIEGIMQNKPESPATYGR